MRLLESIVFRGFSDRYKGDWKVVSDENRRALSRLMIEAPLFDISNVAEYFYSGTDQDFFDIREDFPSVAPPFPLFWMEWTTPTTIRRGQVIEAFPCRPRNGTAWQFVEADRLNDSDLSDGARDLIARNPGTRWIAVGGRYIGHAGQALMSTFGAMYAIATDGRPLANALVYDTANRPTVHEAGQILSGFHPDLLAISFMHCKNVSAEQAPCSFAERHASRSKRQTARFHTLTIDPMKATLKTEGRSGELGIKQALHICRGHFKDYRQSGLFGKVKGIFWWDSTVRGSSKHGVVTKDYNVKAPI